MVKSVNHIRKCGTKEKKDPENMKRYESYSKEELQKHIQEEKKLLSKKEK